MRYPVQTRDDALFNMSLLFQGEPPPRHTHQHTTSRFLLISSYLALRDRRVSLAYPRGGEISANDLVDGHREKTFTLLWRFIFQCDVLPLLDISSLKREVAVLVKSLPPSILTLLQDQLVGNFLSIL